MIRLGLTGSIATGKSTTAAMFAAQGVPVHDADGAVHAIYAQEGVEPVGALIPSAIVDGVVDRAALKAALQANPTLFAKLEAIVHPLVHAREKVAADEAQQQGHAIMVFDVPLLFEAGGEARMDKVAVVHCTPETQLARLMARPGMDDATAHMLMDRQMPQAEKMARADFLIATDHGVDATQATVCAILDDLRA